MVSWGIVFFVFLCLWNAINVPFSFFSLGNALLDLDFDLDYER